MRVEFTIQGEPQGKARARTVRNRYTGTITSYTPERTVLYEKMIAIAYKQKTAAEFGTRPVVISIYAYYGIPKSWSNKKKADADRELIFPTKKPDVDNIAKAVCDALNGVAYKDDSQIVRLFVHKFYSHIPRVEVEIFDVGTEMENA